MITTAGARLGPILPRRFYERPATEVARDLLGKVLIHGATGGVIVETEAYLGLKDAASHAYCGVTERNKVMFGPPGFAYVYFIYGMYECVNVVCEPEGSAGAVLIRAVEPLLGIELMKIRRPGAKRLRDVASGPGKLTIALGITRALNGADVTRGPLMLRDRRGADPFEIEAGPRIGISKCADWPLRFTVAGSEFVSR
ncbi:MAG TPA: DNA-3-methyladenine glycosylase [Bryobacteraceae bacterium]|jgi:DNA-3-methyladenine glycosylase